MICSTVKDSGEQWCSRRPYGCVREVFKKNTVEHGMVSAPRALRYVRAASSLEAEVGQNLGVFRPSMARAGHGPATVAAKSLSNLAAAPRAELD